MKITIHQPNYLPYLGYFDKLRQADLFVFLDDVQFSKGGYTNRNRIKSKDGVRWLTVPVRGRGEMKLISKMEISKGQDWQNKHLDRLHRYYGESENFDLVYDCIRPIYEKDWSYLANLNRALIHAFMRLFGISVKTTLSSRLNIFSTATQKLVDICKAMGATEYLSGKSGEKYLDTALFDEAGIEVVFHNFEHPTYRQFHGEFVSALSSIDYLLNVGDRPFWEEMS